MTEPKAPIGAEDDDARLVEAARAGDREAFNELYRRHARTVRAVLLARSKYEDVPDLVQDVFLTAWSRLGQLRDARAFGAWVATIARNRALAFLRRPRVSFTELHNAPDTALPDAGALEALAVISSLPDTYRETLVMRFVEGMTGPEIASRTGFTEGSVRVNLHRGLKLLRERLRPSEGSGRSS